LELAEHMKGKAEENKTFREAGLIALASRKV
jgi:hypothetical protein